MFLRASWVALMVKNLPANAEDSRNMGSIPESGRSLGEGNDNPLQYSCLGNPRDRGASWATVHGVTNILWTPSFSLYRYAFWKWKWSHSVMSNSLRPHRLQPKRLLCPWDYQARILEWITIPFSRRSFWPRNRTGFFCIAGGFFTSWATSCL